MRVSLLLPYSPTSGDDAAKYAELVAAGLAHRLWLGQTVYADPHQLLTYLAGSGLRIPTGTAVTLIPLRHPWEAALQARSIALLSGQSYVAGFGQGGNAFVRAMRGSAYASPLSAMGEYLSLVRSCLDGDPVTFRGEYQTMIGTMPSIPTPTVYLGVGVLQERMAHVAGRLADVAITWLTPRRYLSQVLLPALGDGGARENRTRPAVAVVVPFALTGPGRRPWKRLLASCGMHLQQPHYRAMLRAAGIALDDVGELLRSLLETETFLWGTAEEVAGRLRSWEAIGVDEIILNPLGTHVVDSPEEALESLREVLAAWRDAPTAVVVQTACGADTSYADHLEGFASRHPKLARARAG